MTSDTGQWKKWRKPKWFSRTPSNILAPTTVQNQNSHEPSMVSMLGINCLCMSRVFFTAMVLGFLGLIFLYHAELKVALFYGLNMVRTLGYLRGSIVLCIANVVGALLFLPCLPFTLGAGFIYGTLMGTIIVTVASNIAAMVAFFVARYLARDIVEHKLGGRTARLRLLDNAIAKEGLKIVFLIRSSPIHPYGVCNYLFGLTSVGLRDYMIGNLVGMLPTTITEVYFGTAMKNLADLVNGHITGPAGSVFFWLGLLMTIIITIYISCYLKMKLDFELAKYSVDDEEEMDILNVGVDRDSPIVMKTPLKKERHDSRHDHMGSDDDDHDIHPENEDTAPLLSFRNLQ